jgi:transcriptional regulator with GAF, ATPase, and Fis domain
MTTMDLAADLHEVAALVTDREPLEAVLDRALCALDGLVPHDLAAVLRREGDVLRVVAARGRLANAAVRAHRLPLSRFPTVRRAMESRRPVALEAHDHASEEGDPYDGVLDLPEGHGCMVVPLFAGGRDLGVITLDRETCGVYDAPTVALAGVVGQLVALALWQAEQAALLDRYRHQLEARGRQLQEDLGSAPDAVQALEASASPRMRALVGTVRQVAASDLPVLVTGETGVGKELVARALHAWSGRVDGPFVTLNCAALPEALVASELFGHVRGAFSGAERARAGRFVTANGGTLLLDEVGELPPAVQATLLRVLQEGSFEPVGSDDTVRVDVRVVAATHVDLREAVARGTFREDLYYRLTVVPLEVPPLRQRPEDVVPIAEAVLAARARGGRGPWSLTAEAEEALRAAPWPGNVRELRHAVERATAMVTSGPLRPVDLGLAAAAPVSRALAGMAAQGGLPTFDDAERAYFRAVLDAAGGKLYGEGGAAAIAGLKPTTLRSRLVKLGLR